MFTYIQKFDHKTDVNHLLVLRSLLNSDIDPNTERTDEPLKYPVFYALRDNDCEKVSALVEHGLKVNLRNSFGQTPI